MKYYIHVIANFINKLEYYDQMKLLGEGQGLHQSYLAR